MRFRSRHVQQTLADHLQDGLDQLGWVSTPRNFDLASPVRFIDVDVDELIGATAEETAELRSRMEGYVVAVGVQEQDPQLEEEMGGPLRSVVMEVTVDVWGELTSVTMSLTDDIRDLLSEAFINLKDYGQDPVVTLDDYIEPMGVRVLKPPGNVVGIDFKKKWRIVGLDARVYFGVSAVGA